MFKAEQALGPSFSSALRLLFRWINRSWYMSLISVSEAVNNMDVSVLCLLTVALSFGSQPSTAILLLDEKPGACPMTNMLVRPVEEFCRDRCYSDAQCWGTQKCCMLGCRRVCVEPDIIVSPPKPGSCPRPNQFERCLRKCRSDEDCRGDDKCCPSRCGQTCMKPVKDEPKPGSCPCPRRSPLGLGTCVQECSSDNDCDGDFKCCSNGCGQVCMEPITVPKLGLCPSPHPVKCEICLNDHHCGRRQLCCPNNCNVQTCTTPFRGRCPELPVALCEDECTEDCNCPRNLKCCYNNCEGRKTCIEPGAVFFPEPGPGACPPPGPFPPFESYVSEPKPGSCPCPKRLPFSVGTCPRGCTSDHDCERNLKCCSSHCGPVCSDPITCNLHFRVHMCQHRPRPGTCPRRRPMFPYGPCKDQCSEDHDLSICEDECYEDCSCPKNLKCCYNKCERRKTCVDPGAVTSQILDQECALIDILCFLSHRVRISALKTTSAVQSSSAVTAAALGPSFSSALRLLFRWINRSSYMSLISVSAAVNNMDVSVLCLLTVALSFGPQPSSQMDPVEKFGTSPTTNIPALQIEDFVRNAAATFSVQGERSADWSMVSANVWSLRMCLSPNRDCVLSLLLVRSMSESVPVAVPLTMTVRGTSNAVGKSACNQLKNPKQDSALPLTKGIVASATATSNVARTRNAVLTAAV
ncbi:hypothetical protein WMY93_030461 [Mugilogobius chulae]|uniref:WAP domain-containing protein n=1 Tax=Mugilogobius chulae TaxID=88201 RepID=A0AAW0MFZ0_9GOBI